MFSNQTTQSLQRQRSMSANYKQDTGLRGRPYRDDNLPFPQFAKPHPVGYFSVGTDRDYEPTAAQLRYYKPPKKFPFDLNEGLSLAIHKPDSAYDERLDHLLKFICDHREKLIKENLASVEKPLLGAEFICWRGLLRMLMCTPYEFRQDWCIHVTKYKGSFYLCKRDTEHDKFIRAIETDEQKKMSSWGFKFEQHCLSESPFIQPDTTAPVDECSEFSVVFKTNVSGMDILYGAEMDGVLSEQPVNINEIGSLQGLKFVEVKVSQGNLNPRQQQSYNRFKTRNWWCQSFLVGIQDIYVGMRNEKGLVQKIDCVEVRSLPKLGVNYWTPNTCANFLIQFLNTLRTILADENCPYTTYEFYFNSNNSRVTYECIRGKTEHSFLPDWYVEMLQRYCKPNVKISNNNLNSRAAVAK